MWFRRRTCIAFVDDGTAFVKVGVGDMFKRFSFVAALIALAALSFCPGISAECLTTERDKNGTITGNIVLKDAEVALIESGRPLAISLGVFAGFGFLAGTDLYPLLYHGAWIANAQFVPSLDVDYKHCQSSLFDANDKKATKTSCPCTLEEKFFTKWSRYFAPFTCRFGIIPPKDGVVEPRDPEYMQANALDITVGVALIIAVIVLVRLPAFLFTRNHYKNDEDEASNYGIWSKCPQNKIPCFPVRFWMDFPNLTLKLLVCLHIGLAMSAFSAFEGDNIVGAAVLSVVCIGLPIFSFLKVRNLVNGGVAYIDASKYQGWRDVNSRNSYKTWRQSVLVNRYGAMFKTLKSKRWWWTSYRMFFNLLEALIILGIPMANDLRGAIVVLLYFIQALVLLLVRPYLSAITWSLELIQLFHNVFIYMASTLYNHDSAIFNAQDIMQVQTDGVEQMMIVLGSGMTVIHIVFVFFLSANTFYSSFMHCQKGGDSAEWDIECNDKRSGTRTLGDSGPVLSRAQINQRKTGSAGSWIMKKVESAPVLEHSQEELGTGAHANPLRAKIAAKRAAALEKQKKVEMTEAAVNLEVAVKEEEPGPEAEPAAEPAAPGLAPLPEGWGEAADPGTGNVYYYNTVTHETQWERPT